MKNRRIKVAVIAAIIIFGLGFIFVQRVPIAMSLFWLWDQTGYTSFEVNDASKEYRFKLTDGNKYDPMYNPGLVRFKVGGQLEGNAKIFIFSKADSAKYYGHEIREYAHEQELKSAKDMVVKFTMDFYAGNEVFITYIPKKGTKGKLIVKAKI